MNVKPGPLLAAVLLALAPATTGAEAAPPLPQCVCPPAPSLPSVEEPAGGAIAGTCACAQEPAPIRVGTDDLGAPPVYTGPGSPLPQGAEGDQVTSPGPGNAVGGVVSGGQTPTGPAPVPGTAQGVGNPGPGNAVGGVVSGGQTPTGPAPVPGTAQGVGNPGPGNAVGGVAQPARPGQPTR